MLKANFTIARQFMASEASEARGVGRLMKSVLCAAAAAILAAHMDEAEQHMLGLQAELVDRFLIEETAPAPARKRRTA